MDRTVIERALQLLLHARNSHGSLRQQIRSLIRTDIELLKGIQWTSIRSQTFFRLSKGRRSRI